MPLKKKPASHGKAKRTTPLKAIHKKTKPPTPVDDVKERMKEHYKKHLIPWCNERKWDDLQRDLSPSLVVYRKGSVISGADKIRALWKSIFDEKNWKKIHSIEVGTFLGQYPAPPDQVIENPEDKGLIETAFAILKVQYEGSWGEVDMLAVFQHQQDCTWFPVLESWNF